MGVDYRDEGPTILLDEPESAEHTLQLVVDGVVSRHPLPAGRALTVGRAKDADIRVEHESVSRRHATLELRDGELWVEDLGSANGSIVGGTRLAAHVKTQVVAGELVELGAVTALVQSRVGAKPERRIRSHAYFTARLDELCEASPSARHAIIHVGPRAPEHRERVEAAVMETLASRHLLARYAPGELELLMEGAGAGEARAWLVTLQQRLGPKVATHHGYACHPEDGRSAHALLGKAHGHDERPSSTASEPLVLDGAMRRVYAMVDRIAPSELPVLIEGETGVGKELLAEAVHRASRRRGPLVRINCAAIAESLLESELFGHEKGAFTGATQAKPGIIESAHQGTVFLDEVGELPGPLQSKLLRVLECKQIQRVGALRPRAIDARFVSATNRNLEAEVRAGRFRNDLYFRLNGVTLFVPPLRERPAEVLELAKRFVREAAERIGRGAMRLDRSAEIALTTHAWPGNVRELRNAIERAVLLEDGDQLGATHLPATDAASSRPALRETDRPFADDGAERLAPAVLAERARILEALEACHGNQTRAAAQLGMSRGTLLMRLDALRIKRPRKSSPFEG
ncbi:MAG: sigma 54-interacting transcriptional regulator [Polyangia bacterium]